MSAASANLSRREFLVTSATTAGALVVGFHIPFAGAAAETQIPEINAWVVVKPDDTVVIRIARSEMGQGTLTGLAQLVAEELECDWRKVTTEYPTPGENLARKRTWGSFSTGGSRGIRDSHEYVRKGGAAARLMLVQAAADGWKVPPAECSVSESVITHKSSGRTTTYGKVAAEAAKLKPPENVALKDPKDWKIAGKRLARLDTVDKVTGAQIYGMDLKLPGMLNAAIKDCPVFGGKVKSARRNGGAEAQRREKGRARRRFGGRRGGRHVVACEDRARRAANRVGLRPECERIECQLRAGAEGRARREGGGGRELGG